MAKAVIATRRQQKPIIFCSGVCEQAYFHQVVCMKCGGDEATLNSFENVDALMEVRHSVEKGDTDALRRAWNRVYTQPWQLKDLCKSCGAAMMPRHSDLLGRSHVPSLMACCSAA